MARATRSPLNAHRSSADPPPRLTITTSMSLHACELGERYRDVRARQPALHAHRPRMIRTCRQAVRDGRDDVVRRRPLLHDVTTPTARGQERQRLACAASNGPSAAKRRLSCSSASC